MQRFHFCAIAVVTVLSFACGGTPAAEDTKTPQPPIGEPQATTPQVEQPAEPAAKPKPSWPTYDAVALIPLETLLGNPMRIGPQLSPDGKRLSYVAPHEGVLNIWVRTVGKADDRAITEDKKRGIRRYFWAPNGKQILYMQDEGGDENYHVYAVSADGGAPLDLTPVKGVRAEIMGVEPKIKNHILVGLNDRSPMFHDVYKIDLRTGKRTLVLKNDMNAVGFLADHKLNVRVAQVFGREGLVIKYRRSVNAKWTDLVTWGPEDILTSRTVSFAGDNRALYMVASDGTNTAELRTFNTSTGKATTLASDPMYDVGGLELHPTSYKVEAVQFNRERSEWKVLDKKIAKDFAALEKLHHGDFWVVDRDLRDRTWLVAYVQDKGPVAYYAWNRREQAGTFLFSHMPALDELPLTEMKPVSYKARDGLTIHGYLTLPAGVEAKNLPAVINPHGGPWARDGWGYNPEAQWLANRGYAVLQPNFRGSTGYGKRFVNAADKEWGGKMQDDITDGTKWLIEQGIADPGRICIMGGSYGGYATLMGLAKEPDLYACGVDIVGVANLITWMKNLPPYWRPWAHIIHERVGHPEKEADFLKSRSPVFLADKIKAPLLIAQGANDPRVPKAESTQIRDAVKKSGGVVHYIEFPDEGHGFARPENRLKFYRMAEKFLAEHIGGRAE